MFRLIVCAVVIIFNVLNRIVEGDRYSRLDRSCGNNDDCYEDSSNSAVVCNNGICECNSPEYIRHIPGLLVKAEVECASITSMFLLWPHPFFDEKAFICDSVVGKTKYCRCKSGVYTTYLSRKTCAKEIIVGFGELCRYVTNRCNYTDDLECIGNKCLCHADDMYNFTTSKCEPRKDYLSLHGITEYRVTYGVYCVNSSDCIEGLECGPEQKCKCPSFCTYNLWESACDCGEVPVPVAAITVGVVAGFFISLGWCCTICHTVRRHRKKRRNMSRDPDIHLPHPTASVRTSIPPPHLTPMLPSAVEEAPQNQSSAPVLPHITTYRSEPPPYYSLTEIAPPKYEDCVQSPLASKDKASHY